MDGPYVLELVPKSQAPSFTPKDAQHEGDELVPVARLFADGADQTLRSPSGFPDCPFTNGRPGPRPLAVSVLFSASLPTAHPHCTILYQRRSEERGAVCSRPSSTGGRNGPVRPQLFLDVGARAAGSSNVIALTTAASRPRSSPRSAVARRVPLAQTFRTAEARQANAEDFG